MSKVTIEKEIIAKIKRWRLNDARDALLMKASHINHPSNIWLRQSKDNYIWLYQMWACLLREYTYRYGKIHKVQATGLAETLRIQPRNIPARPFFEPTPAMPDDVKVPGNSIKSYHNYYNVAKRGFASWQGKVNSRPTPAWYNA